MSYYGPTIVPHDTYQEFRDFVIGKGFDMDNFLGAQCWDGACLIWYQYGLWLYTGSLGYAYECWTESRERNAVDPFEALTGIENIKRGDVLVWNSTQGDGAGHIAYADEDYSGGATINVLGQNQRPVSMLIGSPFSVIPMPLSSVIGIFRNKNWQTTPPPTRSQKKSKFPWPVAWNHWSNFEL